jgi:outer membrane immunogenic protein
MKHTITIFFFAITSTVYGQFSQGTVQLGGTIRVFQDQTNNEYLVGSEFAAILNEGIDREISILPRIGFFISDNTSLGFGIGYTNSFTRQEFSFQTSDDIFENEIRTNLISIEAFSRFHINVSDNFYFFLEPSLTANFGKAKNGLNEEIEENIFGFSIGANPGILYMINNKFGVEGTFGFLGYQQTTRKITEPEVSPEPKNVDKDYGLDLSVRTFELGFQFYF